MARLAVRPARMPCATRPRISSTRPASHIRATRRLDPGVEHLAGGRRPTSTVGCTNSRGGMVALNGRPVSAMTSRARTMRRPLFGSIASAACGVAAPQLGEQGSRAHLVGRSWSAAPHHGVGRRDVELVEQGPHVEPRAADDHRETPCARTPSTSARACRW